MPAKQLQVMEETSIFGGKPTPSARKFYTEAPKGLASSLA